MSPKFVNIEKMFEAQKRYKEAITQDPLDLMQKCVDYLSLVMIQKVNQIMELNTDDETKRQEILKYLKLKERNMRYLRAGLTGEELSEIPYYSDLESKEIVDKLFEVRKGEEND